MRKIPLIVIGVIVALVLFMVLCTFVQRPYEEVILDRFGKIVEPVTLIRGWKLCLPTDRVTRIDHRSHLYTSDLVEETTQGGRPVMVRTFAAWRIVDGKQFYQRQTTDEKAATFLDRLVMDLVAKELNGYTLDRIFNEKDAQVVTDKIEAAILEKANVSLAAEGMRLDQVGFSRMAFPPKIAESVYTRMVNDRKKEADLQRNEGQADARKKVEEGKTESARILTEAEAKASEMRGKGDQAAIEIIGGVTTTPEAKEWFRIFKSMELLRATLNRNTYLILPADSPILANLFNVPANRKDPHGDDAASGKHDGASTLPGLETLIPSTAPGR